LKREFNKAKKDLKMAQDFQKPAHRPGTTSTKARAGGKKGDVKQSVTQSDQWLP
jgi:hypothetical protein